MSKAPSNKVSFHTKSNLLSNLVLNAREANEKNWSDLFTISVNLPGVALDECVPGQKKLGLLSAKSDKHSDCSIQKELVWLGKFHFFAQALKHSDRYT